MADLTNFSIGQGESFKILVSITQDSGSLPIDITDYSFEGKVRENYTTDKVSATFGIVKVSPFESGSIFISLTPDDTITFDQRKYVYDINMSSGSIAPTVRRILEGHLTIRPAATK